MVLDGFYGLLILPSCVIITVEQIWYNIIGMYINYFAPRLHPFVSLWARNFDQDSNASFYVFFFFQSHLFSRVLDLGEQSTA